MPFCTNCGSKTAERAKFCTECGAKSDSSSPIIDSRTPTTSPQSKSTHSFTKGFAAGFIGGFIGGLQRARNPDFVAMPPRGRTSRCFKGTAIDADEVVGSVW